MRYYGNDYLQELIREITYARDCASSQNYALPIQRTEVSLTQERQKHDGLEAASNAYTHISDVKDKYNLLIDILTTYYRSVDEVSSNIVLMTERINSMLDHANDSLVRICNILEGVGDYQGECVTDQNIHSARIDQRKLGGYNNDFWGLAIDTELENGTLDQTTVKYYLAYINRLQFSGTPLPPEEYTRLNSLYEYYVDLRFGTGGVVNLPDEVIYNCVEIYELLNPAAKTITDDFFAEACAQNNEIINKNVARIKYAIYTADPEYRDIILNYMPSLRIASYDTPMTGVDRSHYSGDLDLDDNGNIVTNALYIDLTGNSNKFGNFFHEFAHGIDDVTNMFGNSSDGMHTMLADDLRAHMVAALGEASTFSSEDVSDEEKDLISSLSEERRNGVIDFLISSSNATVICDDDTLFLPWTTEVYGQIETDEGMTAAYHYLKKYYGYKEYGPSESNGYVSHNYFSALSDCVGSTSTRELASDIVGGLTNNAIAGLGGHTAELDGKFDNGPYNTLSEVYGILNNYDYWYGPMGVPTQATSHEFFAEMFDLNVRGIDLTPSRNIFANSCDHYNELIDEIYAGIQ